jgi:3-methyladenine DNA glycosylase/8-oxoguanine DNA glycosylase
VQKLFKLPDLPKRGQIIKLIAPWKPWRGLAAWYLWHKE